MSPTSASHARPGFAGRAWRHFRRWRRTRPFWGGLLLIVSGVEIFMTTQMSLGGLSFQLGPTGFLSWLIPTILVACGALAWGTPAQRMFYAIVGAVTAVFSLIGVNLGGFFLGLVFGILGAGLVFAWTPGAGAAAAPAEPAPPDEPDADTGEIASTGHLVPGLDDPDQEEPSPADSPTTATPATTWANRPGAERSRSEAEAGDRAVADRSDSAAGSFGGSAPAGRSDAGTSAMAAAGADSTGAGESGSVGSTEEDDAAGDAPLPRRDGPRFYAVVGFLLVLATSVVVGMRVATPAYAAPSCPGSGGVTAPKPAETASKPAATPSPSATEQEPQEEEKDGGIIGGIIDGITGIFGGGDSDEPDPDPEPEPATAAAAAGPTATPTPGAPGRATPSTPKPKPGACGPKPGNPGKADEEQPVVPLLDPDPNLPSVNAKPSLLTGTKLTMWNLRLAGIQPLDTADGQVRALKFTMSRSVVETFALRVPQGSRDPLLFTSGSLTVSGDVAFYATRFVGRFHGIKLTLTPDSPLPPDGIPLTIPRIDFDDPQIQLMYVSCHELRAPTLDEGFVAA
ncbi:DUF6114 domain-containing protein [Asanoa siamensis]|uniref:Uncharacterized protein n=1 Tax=Asanoa siamensis TaxID=926357 RepID=A0ABQ4CVM3_9ACTN|nr:DUF6114 domain-containing protein [Asanoa siamensis]GIF75341.1 hypothetical protein Asi02nite_48590 [Asanoa siamensis]